MVSSSDLTCVWPHAAPAPAIHLRPPCLPAHAQTPDDGAIKWWIGNAAEDGRAATVFARLKVPSPDGSGALDDHGVHAFVVPMRDEAGRALPGVEIHDCGYKVGERQGC